MQKEKQTQQKIETEATSPVRFFETLKVEFMVHELKDSVAVIETILYALLDDESTYGALNQRQGKTLKRALLSSKKMRQTLYDLLEIGRGQAKRFICRRCLIDQLTMEVLINALEIQAYTIFEDIETIEAPQEKLTSMASHGIVLHMDKSVINLEVLIDEIKYRQIVINLFKNGLYHRDQTLNIKLHRETTQLVLTVADDGPGVAPEHHQEIFEQYKQVDPSPHISRSGHGLGLAGAQILARCLGGDISVDSQRGQGATFRLTLPIPIHVNIA